MEKKTLKRINQLELRTKQKDDRMGFSRPWKWICQTGI